MAVLQSVATDAGGLSFSLGSKILLEAFFPTRRHRQSAGQPPIEGDLDSHRDWSSSALPWPSTNCLKVGRTLCFMQLLGKCAARPWGGTGQERDDTWPESWMRNAAAAKQQLRKTQSNCSHTSTGGVVPNNHSASVVDRKKKIPSYMRIHIHRRNTHGCVDSQSLSDSALFHFFFLTKYSCTIFTEKLTLKTLWSRTKPLVVA